MKLEYITFKLGFKNVYETLEYLLKRAIEENKKWQLWENALEKHAT